MKKYLIWLSPIVLAVAAMAQTVPAGTALRAKLQNTLTTFTNKAGDKFSATVSEPIVLNGQTVIPAGSMVEGRVTKVSEPRRIFGKPTIGIAPEAIVLPGGERYELDATLVDTNAGRGSDVNEEGQFKGEGHDKKDLAEIGIGAGGGMTIGGLVGGPPGVAIGGAIGAGAGTAHWLGRHRSAMIPVGTELILELDRPMTMGTTAAGQ